MYVCWNKYIVCLELVTEKTFLRARYVIKNIYKLPRNALAFRGRRNVLLQRSFTSDFMVKIN